MPRDPERIPRMLGLLEQVWNQHPDWRLGQLIVNVGHLVDAADQQLTPFYIEDTAMEKALQRYVRQEDTDG